MTHSNDSSCVLRKVNTRSLLNAAYPKHIWTNRPSHAIIDINSINVAGSSSLKKTHTIDNMYETTHMCVCVRACVRWCLHAIVCARVRVHRSGWIYGRTYPFLNSHHVIKLVLRNLPWRQLFLKHLSWRWSPCRLNLLQPLCKHLAQVSNLRRRKRHGAWNQRASLRVALHCTFNVSINNIPCNIKKAKR